ncbi:hypothetical protein [Albibacterium profundi]|uniref:Uncharacterized protein n=1 Tax=Albibacterium profundi TaxID=3134906 RepID=A0ABV5CEV9_9SPHI
MKIEKYEQPKSTSLEIAEAVKSNPVVKVHEDDLRKVLGLAIVKAYQDLGQSMNDEDSAYLSNVLPFEVKKQVPSIRIQEIPIAINRGVYGEYGKYYGLNATTFISFLKAYIETEDRKKAILDYHRSLEPAKKEPTEEEVQEGIKKAIINAYNIFLEKGFYEDYGNFIYDKMDEKNMINLNTARKNEIYIQAQQSILTKKSPQNAGNRSEFKEFTSIVDSISDPSSVMGKEMIKKEAKKIALHVVFSDFKEVEADINELVNQKQEF